MYDCTSQYLNIPCGHCSECISVRQMYLVQRVQMEALENHLFFATLTYNNESLPRLTTSTGFSIPYADIRDLQTCFKRIVKYGRFPRKWSYLAVSERGSERGRPHFHVLFSIPKQPGDSFLDCLSMEHQLFDALLFEWRRNYGSTRSPVYRPLCTFYRKFVNGRLSANYDLHWADPNSSTNGLADIAFYVSKYMLKPSNKEVRLQQALHLNLSSEEYEDTWSVVKSGIYKSHGYGDNSSAVKHIHDSIKVSLANNMDYPGFINPISGQIFPLAPYYTRRAKYYSFDDALKFYYNSKSDRIDTIHDVEKKSLDQFYNAQRKYEKVLSQTSRDYLDSICAIE